MKVISLNTWGGRAGRAGLLDFFKQHQGVDVFCLQEVWSAPYEHLEGAEMGGLVTSNADVMTEGMQETAATLSEHKSYFRPHHLDNYGLQILVKKELKVVEEGDIFVYKERGHVPEGDPGNCARNIQYVTVETSRGLRTILNFHGLWSAGTNKQDTPDRLSQSERIIEFVATLTNPCIICGDFNLLPETESMKKFEQAGFRNLIAEHGITSTRTSYYKKEPKFADYVLVSPDIEVLDFKILPDEVSDHAPLLLEFE